MQVYKREEGLWARVPLAIVGGIVTVIASGAVMDKTSGVASYIWGGLVFAVLGLLSLYFAFLHRKTVGVLIETENEMRKVVWPTREEVSGSTTVVIATTLILGVGIFLADNVLVWVLTLVGLYEGVL